MCIRDSPVDGTVKYMDRTLDYWYKDLEGLLAGQIAKEHINQPAFSYASVDFVIGAEHWQGSFRAGVKIIFRNHNGSIKATAINGLWVSEFQKDTAALLALAFTPRSNVALIHIVCFLINDKFQLVTDFCFSSSLKYHLFFIREFMCSPGVYPVFFLIP